MAACMERFIEWRNDFFRNCPVLADMPGAQTVRAMREVVSASGGVVSSLVFTEGTNIFMGALLSRSASVASAVSAALVMPFNYSIVTILVGAMRASQNFFKALKERGDSSFVGRGWRTALLYAFLVGTCVGIPGFIGVPHLISLLSLHEFNLQKTLSVKLALSYNLIMMAAVPLRIMRSVDRQLFLYLGGKNLLMLALGLFQAALTCGASYGFSTLATRNLWSLSSAQSIACGGVCGAVMNLVITNIYLYRQSQKDTLDEISEKKCGYDFENSALYFPAPDPNQKELSLKKYSLFDWQSARFFASAERIMDSKTGLVIPGMHNALGDLAEILSNLSLIGMMGYLSPTAFIANNIASQPIQLFILLSTGLGMGLQRSFTLKHRKSEGYSYLRAAFLLALGVTALSVSAYGAAPWIISCFINAQDPANQAIIKLAKDLIFQYVFFSFGDHLRNIMAGANQAAQDTKFMMCTTMLCRGVLATGLSAYLGFHAPDSFPSFLKDARGIVSGHFIAVSVGAIVNTARAARHVRRAQFSETSSLWVGNPVEYAGSEGGCSMKDPRKTGYGGYGATR